jgi:hypothetical protein
VIEGFWMSAKKKIISMHYIFQESLVSGFIASKRVHCPKTSTGGPAVSITINSGTL